MSSFNKEELLADKNTHKNCKQAKEEAEKQLQKEISCSSTTKVTRVERKIVINQQAADIEEAGKITKNIKGLSWRGERKKANLALREQPA